MRNWACLFGWWMKASFLSKSSHIVEKSRHIHRLIAPLSATIVRKTLPQLHRYSVQWYTLWNWIYEVVFQIGEAGFKLFATIWARAWCNQSFPWQVCGFLVAAGFRKKQWIFLSHGVELLSYSIHRHLVHRVSCISWWWWSWLVYIRI